MTPKIKAKIKVKPKPIVLSGREPSTAYCLETRDFNLQGNDTNMISTFSTKEELLGRIESEIDAGNKRMIVSVVERLI